MNLVISLKRRNIMKMAYHKVDSEEITEHPNIKRERIVVWLSHQAIVRLVKWHACVGFPRRATAVLDGNVRRQLYRLVVIQEGVKYSITPAMLKQILSYSLKVTAVSVAIHDHVVLVNIL